MPTSSNKNAKHTIKLDSIATPSKNKSLKAYFPESRRTSHFQSHKKLYVYCRFQDKKNYVTRNQKAFVISTRVPRNHQKDEYEITEMKDVEHFQTDIQTDSNENLFSSKELDI